VPKDRLPDIVATAKNDPAVFLNPEDLDEEDYLVVLGHAWDGTPLDRNRIKAG